MILNSTNVEELVLKNSLIVRELSDHADLIMQWRMGQFVPGLRAMAQKAKLDFLNKLTERDIAIISDHLKTTIEVEKLDYTRIKDHTLRISEASDTLTRLDLDVRDFCVSRDGDLLYLCGWH